LCSLFSSCFRRCLYSFEEYADGDATVSVETAREDMYSGGLLNMRRWYGMG
jgi:hypothetical protein